MSGSFFIFLDKPEGLTSQQCLSRFKNKFHFDKVGHHGTLDPFATGLLLVGVNEAAKFFRFVDDAAKTYVAEIEFGAATDTLDKTGKVTERRDVPDWTSGDIETALPSLTGVIRQKPPMFSAVKKDGKRLYELARRGVEVEREEREVRVFELKLLAWDKPFLTVRATVSRGTYVRVLAEQIAGRLGNVAHVKTLRRIELCGVSVEEACKEIPIPRLLGSWPSIEFTDAQRKDLICGRPAALAGPVPKPDAEFHAAFHNGTFLGMVKVSGQTAIAERLMSFHSA